MFFDIMGEVFNLLKGNKKQETRNKKQELRNLNQSLIIPLGIIPRQNLESTIPNTRYPPQEDIENKPQKKTPLTTEKIRGTQLK